MLKSLKKKILGNSFERKLSAFMLLSIVGISVILAGIMLFASLYSTSKIAGKLAKEQEESVAQSLDRQLFSIFQLGQMAAENKIFLEDVSGHSEGTADDRILNNQVSQELLNIKRMNTLIDFVALLKPEGSSVKYVGYKWVAEKDQVYRILMEGYESAKESGTEDVFIQMGRRAFDQSGMSVNFYFPIYDSTFVYREIGIICISVREQDLRDFMGKSAEDVFAEAYLVDEENTVVSSEGAAGIGELCPLSYDSEEGMASVPGGYVYCSEIPSCGWNVVTRISLYQLLKSYLGYVGILLLCIFLVCLLALFICGRIMGRLNSTLSSLQHSMRMVAEGDMESHMPENYQEAEFQSIAHSFNQMVDAVNGLMNQIREEQQQMKQIELEALQAQIKPHFLYNTLESIHWQAFMDGNEKISRLVKALAQYYRLCLGKGAEIVPLSQELEHIENYLIIQNMRYKNILELHTEIPEEFLGLSIPKMTLQPLVENCIYHGVKGRKGIQGIIEIRAERRNADIHILVRDNGRGMPRKKLEELNGTIRQFDGTSGYGVKNVDRRLALYFGPGAGLRYESEMGKGTTVTIRLPAGAVGEGGGKTDGEVPNSDRG